MTSATAGRRTLPGSQGQALPAGIRALPRLAAFFGLSLLGLMTWAGLVAPSATGSATFMALAATACGGALIAAGRLDRRPRNLVLAGLCVALPAAMLVGAGIPARLLAPGDWDTLAQGIVEGIGSIPGTFVPYRGGDEWVRRTLLLGGTALVAIAVLQAFWPRERGRLPGSPAAAAVSLGTLYAVPVISRATTDHPFLSGALFTLLLCAFLLADRMRASTVAPALLLVVAVTIGAAAAAPALDRPAPWVDYEKLAEDVASRGTVGYSWDHTYRPIDWPRDGRELLRIKAQAQAYWKAEALDAFDGRAWRRTESVATLEPDGEQDLTQPQWFQTIQVSVRALRSSQFITAGSANRVFDAPRLPVSAGAGTFVTQRGVLRRGAEYKATVYTPRPTAAQLQNSGTDYPSLARQWLRVTLQAAAGATSASPRPGIEATFPPFGSGEATLINRTNSGIDTIEDGPQVLRDSSLGRIYDLAERLRAQAATPQDYVQLVRRRVQRGATYTETPNVHSNPLDAFLFEDRDGYCQHFSGAMALLLRMGGVPARVAVGFSPGQLNKRTGEYIVRDLDAHSWVEAYFPRYGWVTLDPTPSAAPAREQVADQQAALTRPRGADPGGDRASDPAFGGPAPASGGDSSTARWAIPAAIVALLAVAGGAFYWRVRRRERELPCSDDPEIADLERALRRTGRELPPDLTLAALERRLGASEAARGYLRALSARRYGAGGPAPTGAERAALRRELAAGLGRMGRLRALWALPPRQRGGRGTPAQPPSATPLP